jgi:uncharacterized protein (TIRG00374 family)
LEASGRRGSRAWLALLVSVLIGVALLWWAGRGLSWEALSSWARGVDKGRVVVALAGYAALFGLVHFLRMWRWVYLLRHLGEYSPWVVLRASAVGSAAILLLPLRLGELVRPYVLARDTGCALSAALGTAVVERVVDGLVITFLLFATLSSYEGSESTLFATALGYVCLVIFAGALLVCLGALWRREGTMSVLGWVLGRVHPGLSRVLLGMLGAFLDGVQSLREGRSLVQFLLVTLAYWGVNGLSIGFLASEGFGLPVGPWEGMTVLAILVVGIMIPAGPGLAGNYELFTLKALGLFASASEVSAAGAAFVGSMHAVQFLVQVLPGLLLVWGRGGLLGLRREAEAAVEVESKGSGVG